MQQLLRDIYHAVKDVIDEKRAFRAWMRQWREGPPEQTKWRDAVSNVTLEQWRERVDRLTKRD